MKKILMLISIFSASILLTGCVSIPLGDGGKLEISQDGINVNTGDEEELELDDEGEMDGADEENVTNEETPVEENEDEKDEGEANNDQSSTDSASSASCDAFIEDAKGNDRLLKALAKLAPPNFPLADCTLMGSLKEGYSTTYEAVTADTDFKVEGYWADVFDRYVDYMESAGFESLSKREDAPNQTATVTGKTADYDLDLFFKQRDADDGTEFVSITFGLYHYDTPRDIE